MHLPLQCQLQNNFHHTNVVIGVRSSGVISSWTVYGTQWSPITQFPYRKGLGANALLRVSRTLQRALERGHYTGLIQIYFSAAFDRVKHQEILFKLCSVGI